MSLQVSLGTKTNRRGLAKTLCFPTEELFQMGTFVLAVDMSAQTHERRGVAQAYLRFCADLQTRPHSPQMAGIFVSLLRPLTRGFGDSKAGGLPSGDSMEL